MTIQKTVVLGGYGLYGHATMRHLKDFLCCDLADEIYYRWFCWPLRISLTSLSFSIFMCILVVLQLESTLLISVTDSMVVSYQIEVFHLKNITEFFSINIEGRTLNHISASALLCMTEIILWCYLEVSEELWKRSLGQ